MKKLSFLIVLLIFIAACNNSTTGDQSQAANTEQLSAQEGVIEVAVIDVSGLHCESCVNTITTALNEIDGITDTKVSLEQEQAKFKFEPAKVSMEDVKKAIEGKGYGMGEVEIISLEEQSGNPDE